MTLNTRNDVSAGEVTLDYQLMLDVTRSDFSYALNSIYKQHSRLSAFPYTESTSMRKILAEGLVQDAYRLQKAADMLSTLEDGLTRENIKITNHPLEVLHETTKRT